MQTNFSADQLLNPKTNTANEILRKCVHCGFCTATCPTYILLGDELDSPRGRIYLIKEMLENDKAANQKIVKHLDRCLSCLSCMSTCPASVNYMRLIDHARVHIEKTYKRPLSDRLLRRFLAFLLPHPKRFRFSILCARIVRPFASFFPKRLKGLILTAPPFNRIDSSINQPQVFSNSGSKKKQVALLTGCVQQIIQPNINEATVRLLTRHGCEVIIAKGIGCCGALVHHLGQENASKQAAKANIVAWEKAGKDSPIDTIVVNASGCGTTIKDYAYLLNDEPEWAYRAAKISSITRDVTEVITEIGLNIRNNFEKPHIAYHSACSLQHGQQLHEEPKLILSKAGFEVSEPVEAHICCGSAGTYSFLQPDLSSKLLSRKIENLKVTGAQVIATGNIGCLSHISLGMQNSHRIPVVHTVELLDWATGGPKPAALP